ncbi:MAG: hypothetical protein IJS82_06005 [Paludibacteraceae bacterium]|nr:hypothetical protein [Paludibacteraceae bacterium]
MVQTQPTLQSVLDMVAMLPYDDQKQLVNKVHYNLALVEQDSLIDPNWRKKPTYSVDEVFESAYKHLGRLYGLNDIREAKE